MTQILDITLPILVIVLLGFFYSRAVKPELAGVNRMTIDLLLPILIFTSMSSKGFDPRAALLFCFAVVLHIGATGILALPLAKLSGAGARAFLPCAMFTNVGPIGIPLIVLAYGAQGLPLAVVLLVVSNILHFTLGAGIMSGRIDWRMLYANPLVWATLLGLGFAQGGLHLPLWLDRPLAMISAVIVPLMLLSLGARLSSSQVRYASAGLRGAVLAAAVRLVACFAILWLLPLSGLERGAFILYACLPSAMFNFMLADKFNVAPNRVASIVIMGHVASLALLPLGLWLAL